MAGAGRLPRPNGAEEAAGPGENASSPQIDELQELNDEVFELTIVHEIVLNGDLKLQAVNFPPHREIFRVLDVMKMDMLNFTTQSVRPYLQEFYVQYEQEKFQEILDKFPKWWIHQFLSLLISPSGQNSEKDFPKGLDAIQEELQEVGRRFRSVTFHKRQVFGPSYSSILKKALFPEAEPDSRRDSF